MIKNTYHAYGHLTKILHWMMAIAFIVMFGIAYIMTNIDKSGFRDALYDFHKATGILLFILAICRLVWRSVNVNPTLPDTICTWQRQAAKYNIILLYLVMFFMPVTGFLTSTLGGHPISFYSVIVLAPLAEDPAVSLFFSNAHEIISYLFIAAFSMHVLGSLYHHYFLKDGLLRRMWAS